KISSKLMVKPRLLLSRKIVLPSLDETSHSGAFKSSVIFSRSSGMPSTLGLRSEAEEFKQQDRLPIPAV
ncbi:MAG: hypothetical protein LRZ88_00860, partial [Candidatus Cloacimonetes bacterium]|nr:hypothetical protein [Candidatus Cloacimonadota bacterium]